MIFAETSAFRTPYAEKYTFFGPDADYDMSRVLDAGWGLAQTGRIDHDAYVRLRVTMIDNGDYIDSDARLAETFHRTLDEFDVGLMAYCRPSNIAYTDSDVVPPIIVGRDGLQRDVNANGELTVTCDDVRAVLGDKIAVANAIGATTVAFQSSLRFDPEGNLRNDELPQEHISMGVMYQEEYYPIATMFDYDAHPNPHALSASRPAGILAVSNVVNVAPRQYSPVSL
jgi:hypothetical protein